MDRITTTITGISGYGNTHYEDLLRRYRRGEISILGAAVINQDEEQEKCAVLRSLGCRIFSSHGEMMEALKGQVDLSFITTGIGLHAPMAMEAMAAGADALIEKPAAPVIQDILALKQAEKQYGRRVWVGFQVASQSQIRRIREFCHAPEFGKILAVHGLGAAPRGYAYYHRNQWAGRLLKDGQWILDSPYNNAFAHYLHLSLLFAGKSDEVPEYSRVRAQLFRVNPELECADNGCIQAWTTGGIPVSFYTTHTPEKMNELEIVVDGEHGSVRWTFGRTFYRLGDCCEEAANERGDELRDLMLDALFARCRGLSDGNCCDLDSAALHTRIVNAAHESSPVTAVPAEFAEQLPGEDPRWILHGLDQEMRSAWEQGRAMDRAVFPWLPESAVVDLSDYCSFNGGLCLGRKG